MGNIIKINYTNPEINDMLKISDTGSPEFTRHYNQVEEFFIKLKDWLLIPPLPIHHDVNVIQPDTNYIKKIKQLLSQILPLTAGMFKDLTYFFDPTEILKPSFYQLYKMEQNNYLFLLRLNLGYRPHDDIIINRGDNDISHEYKTKHLLVDSVLIPIEQVILQLDKIFAFKIKQLITETWIDERGRGYFVQGIWMDDDLTKFFSKLFLPQGKTTYPYYPFICKYKTICQHIIDFEPPKREKNVPQLDRTIKFLMPKIEAIQSHIKDESFSEDHEIFQQIKKEVPPAWIADWQKFNIELYLNDNDMREFRIEN